MSLVDSLEIGRINLQVLPTKEVAGAVAAKHGASLIRQAIAERGEARVVFAAAASQFEMFAHLVAEPGVDWSCVTAFHLDEYIGLSADHPSSFQRFLKERFCKHLSIPLRAFHFLSGEEDSGAECRRVGRLIEQGPIDVAFVGIGENGHLAFNDPPADFLSEVPYHVVELDEACRKQQYNEGWFETLDRVPRQAISMTIQQVMSCQAIICTVLDDRKAAAVKQALTGDVAPACPASILQLHENVHIYLDRPAASLLAEGR
ncbi:MAG TPA: glucosamine-6-phosphate deaminase [Lacipirellulaceae bacterium]|nr:glucosamine-6-phosphate deaminase [Lacipirellulaceae bacterium]